MIPGGKGPRAAGQHIAPDAGHQVAAVIPQDQGEVRLAGLVGAGLCGADQEILLDHGAFLEAGDGLMGHGLNLSGGMAA